MGGNHSRRKGASGERELAHLLEKHLDVKLVRNLSQSRDGGHDLTGLDNMAFEVKRTAKSQLSAWWKQAVVQAEDVGRVPVLAYRLDRQSWRFVVALADTLDSCCHQPRELK